LDYPIGEIRKKKGQNDGLLGAKRAQCKVSNAQKINFFKNLRGDSGYFRARSCKNACNTRLLSSVNWLGLL
jgi:hypothetical protein